MKKSAKPKQRGVGKTLRIYEYEGKKYSIKRLSELSGINFATIASRLRRGWSVEDACTKTVDAFHNGHKAKSECPPGKRRFSGRSYKNSEQRLNELREKYKNGVTADILREFAEKLQKGDELHEVH